MTRKRKAGGGAEEQNHDHDQGNLASYKMVKEAAAGPQRTRKKFVGVRQRMSGRWVAEIKDTVQKIRVWLGTFDTAEEAARAYDEAACLLRGANTRTNFWPCSLSSSTAPALPSKITNLLLQRLKARNNSIVSASSSSSVFPIHQLQHSLYDDEDTEFSHTKLTDFLNDPEDYTYSISLVTHNKPQNEPQNYTSSGSTTADYPSTSFESRGFSSGDGYLGGETEEEGEEQGSGDLGFEDFQFVDEVVGSCYYYSPFEIAAEISSEPMEQEICGDEPSMLREAIKRMKYERKFSASLYAFNGINECLRLKLGADARTGTNDQLLASLRNACHEKNQEDGEKVLERNGCESKENEESSNEMGSPSTSKDGELSLWNSLDLPNICVVN